MIQAADENDALFHRNGDWLEPSELTQGPWDPEHQHGGPVCAALAWASEQEPAPVAMRTVRIGFDLMHPVPLKPLRTEVRVARAGRRVQLLDVALLEGERAVARASALRVRVDAEVDPVTASGPVGPALELQPDDLEPLGAPRRFGEDMYVPGYIRAVDLRRSTQEPSYGESVMAWSRLRCRVVEGEEPSPLVKVAALADFVSGMGNSLDFTRFVSINPDLMLEMLRPPESDWIGFETITTLSADGIGHSRGTLHDTRGPIGHASAALYVAPR